MKSPRKPLSPPELAKLYVQLAHLEKSGISTQQAVAMLFTIKGETGKRAEMTLNYLKRGKSLSDAGTRAGLFVGLDAALVKVAEDGGTQGEVFQQLAQFYEEKARQIQQIKSKLLLPLLVFLLAVFIQPVPALILGNMTLGSYLGTTLSFIIQLALVILVLLYLPRWFRHGLLQPFRSLWDNIEINTPYFGYWQVRRQVRNFMQALGLMLQAGLPILEALPKAYEVLENTILRQRFQKIRLYLQKGDSFTEALVKVPGVNPVAVQLVATGEEAGSLADMILHYVKLESEEIRLHNDIWAAWIPRLVYALIMIWMVYGILSAGVFVTPIPEDI